MKPAPFRCNWFHGSRKRQEITKRYSKGFVQNETKKPDPQGNVPPRKTKRKVGKKEKQLRLTVVTVCPHPFRKKIPQKKKQKKKLLGTGIPTERGQTVFHKKGQGKKSRGFRETAHQWGGRPNTGKTT